MSAGLGEIDFMEDRPEQGIDRMERAFSLLADEEPDSDLVTLAAQLGRLHLFDGTHGLAAERLEFALGLAEKLDLPEQLSQALNSKAVLLDFQERHEEARALVVHSLKVALDNDLYTAALRAYNNLAAFLVKEDRPRDALVQVGRALKLTRRKGDRNWELFLLAGKAWVLTEGGEWDQVVEIVEELDSSADLPRSAAARLLCTVPVYVHQGALAHARERLELHRWVEQAEDIQMRSAYASSQAVLL